MQTYETIFITRPTLTEDEEKSTVEVLAQIVTGGGGTFAANDRMGRRRLAYPILKQTDGVYVRFLYDSGPEVPKELERRCRLSDDVLRAMTVRLEPNWAVAAKEQAVRDEEARVEAERAERERALEEERKAAEAAAAPPAPEEPPGSEKQEAAEPQPETPAEAPSEPPVKAEESESAKPEQDASRTEN
jgi:small subunit ribosomal protein S6